MSGFDARIREEALLLGEAHALDMVGIVAKPVRAAELRALLASLQNPATSQSSTPSGDRVTMARVPTPGWIFSPRLPPCSFTNPSARGEQLPTSEERRDGKEG